jgi:hypothetical protein
MARKTDGEKIDELMIIVTSLKEELAYVRREKVDVVQFVRVEERLEQLRKDLEEASRRRWSLVPSLVGGIIGAGLTFLGQLLLKRLNW